MLQVSYPLPCPHPRCAPAMDDQCNGNYSQSIKWPVRLLFYVIALEYTRVILTVENVDNISIRSLLLNPKLNQKHLSDINPDSEISLQRTLLVPQISILYRQLSATWRFVFYVNRHDNILVSFAFSKWRPQRNLSKSISATDKFHGMFEMSYENENFILENFFKLSSLCYILWFAILQIGCNIKY